LGPAAAGAHGGWPVRRARWPWRVWPERGVPARSSCPGAPLAHRGREEPPLPPQAIRRHPRPRAGGTLPDAWPTVDRAALLRHQRRAGTRPIPPLPLRRGGEHARLPPALPPPWGQLPRLGPVHLTPRHGLPRGHGAPQHRPDACPQGVDGWPVVAGARPGDGGHPGLAPPVGHGPPVAPPRATRLHRPAPVRRLAPRSRGHPTRQHRLVRDSPPRTGRHDHVPDTPPAWRAGGIPRVKRRRGVRSVPRRAAGDTRGGLQVAGSTRPHRRAAPDDRTTSRPADRPPCAQAFPPRSPPTMCMPQGAPRDMTTTGVTKA